MFKASKIRDYRLAFWALAITVVLVVLRLGLIAIGIDGIPLTPLTSSVIAGGVFVMSLVIVGVLTNYREAERAPSELAGSLYSMLREAEAIERVWAKPDLHKLRERLINVVATLRTDIYSGNTRDCQAAVEDLSQSLHEMEDSDVPANYIVRLRGEQSTLRKAVLKVYNVQREEFLPSAYAMIVSFVVMIVLLLLFTNIDGSTENTSHVESVATLAFLSFFFVYLLLLLNVISVPFKVGQDRTDDDVSLFLLYEFVVYAQLGDTEVADTAQIVEAAEAVEEAVDEAAPEAVADEDIATLVAEATDEVVDDAAARPDVVRDAD